MFSWASWCCWYSKTRNFCITSSQDLIYSKKNEGNLKKLPKSAKNWPHMSNFPQLFGQNSTILWSRHVVLMSMKLTMPKKEGFSNVLWSLDHLIFLAISLTNAIPRGTYIPTDFIFLIQKNQQKKSLFTFLNVK